MDRTTNKFCFLMPVWGGVYVDFFLQYSLASQLAPGNLDSLLGDQHVYCIYTFERDIPSFEKSPTFQLLKSIIPVRFELVDTNISDHRLCAAECYQKGIAYAQQLGAVVVLAMPDVLYSRNSFVFMQQQLNNGFKAIVAPCHSVDGKKAVGLLAKFRAENQSLNLSGRDCIDIVLHAMDTNTKNKFYEGQGGKLSPASMCWQVADQGLISHSFHLPPVAAILPNSKIKFAGSIDNDFLIQVCPNPADIFVVQDTDQFCLFEIVESNHVNDASYQKGNPDHVVSWAIVHANAQHRAIFPLSLYQKSNNYHASSPDWDLVDAKASALVNYVQSNLHSSKFSIKYLLKHRYAFLRKYIMQLQFTERLQASGWQYWLAKTILGAHRCYLKFAMLFSGWQHTAMQNLLSFKPDKPNSFFNLYYWPRKVVAKDLLLLLFKQDKLFYSSELNADHIFQAWFQVGCLKKSQQELALLEALNLTPTNININKSLIHKFASFVPKIINWRLQRNNPMLLQLLQFPFLYSIIAFRILAFNLGILILGWQEDNVSFNFYLNHEHGLTHSTKP